MPCHMTALQRPALALALSLILAGCTFAPMGPATRPAPVAPATSIPPQTMPDAAAPLAEGTAGAEQACIAAGRERGLDVAGVVGSRAVAGSNGEAGRDVMLRVRRSGAEIEVRCNYVTETRMARIMLI